MSLIVTRRQWGAEGAAPRGAMKLPARELWLHHTVTAVTKDPYDDMRLIDRIGRQRFGQISYSYCVHPDGTILEGCGDRVGAHTAGRNATSFGVALIGNYDERSVTVWQIDAVRWLVDHLVAIGQLREGVYPTGGHRDLKATSCPGDKAYRLLDAMRVPWADIPISSTGELTVPDNADLPNITGPVTYTFIYNPQTGEVYGYYCWSATTAELHSHGGVPYFGRSEVVG